MEAPACKLCGKRHYGLCPEAFRSEVRLEPHHRAWLAEHPKRTEDWLRSKLDEGFHVHHLNGDHSNNQPDNLLLIDGSDHRRLHRKIMAVLHNTKAPFDRTAYQRDLMRKRRAKKREEKAK